MPALILVSAEHADFLLDEFGRYRRDYELHAVASAAEAEELAREIRAGGGDVALFVAESVLPDANVLEAFGRWRAVVPTARRMVAAHWSHFLADADALRAGLAMGKYDAYLLMPRGVRDEEFHTAVTELLSDWGSTVAAPEVESVRIISPVSDALNLSIRDFLDRMGMPNGVHAPDSDTGREVLADYTGTPTYPVVQAMSRRPVSATNVHDVRERLRPHRPRRASGAVPRRAPADNLATTASGIFAAGDVRAGSMKRVAAASGEGASVVPLVHAWVESLR
jgi:thioredoxin reductase (NADPH)